MTRTSLTAHDKQLYHRRLQELSRRLSGEVGQLETEVLHPADPDGVEAPTPGADRPARAAEEDVARALIASESQILDETRAALGRVADGSFGTCGQCQHRIAKARLDVVPYTRTCSRCARTADAAQPQ